MGIPNVNDGSIERADLDGQNRTMIVPPGGTFTPKQIHLDKNISIGVIIGGASSAKTLTWLISHLRHDPGRGKSKSMKLQVLWFQGHGSRC